MKIHEDMGNKTKQTGKTEVYPFWYMEDMLHVINKIIGMAENSMV